MVLYDDHGEAWTVTLAYADGRQGTDEMDVPRASGCPAIEFLGADGEPLRVAYEGAATCEEELLFDEVVVHFLKAKD